MHPDKRREGRRIRKQRRKWEQVSKAFMRMSDPKPWEKVRKGMEDLAGRCWVSGPEHDWVPEGESWVCDRCEKTED